jgi:transcriptional regulator with XRE-family HTH domain
VGLDSHFFICSKELETEDISISDISALVENNHELQNSLSKLNAIAKDKNVSLDYLLNTTITDYIQNYKPNRELIAHFRNFHYLNDFFNYTDAWYNRDKPVTKKQCIELRYKAKKCLDEINLLCNNNHWIAYLDSVHKCYKDVYSDKELNLNIVINKYFIVYKDQDIINKIKELYNILTIIIEDAKWNNEFVVYNADW